MQRTFQFVAGVFIAFFTPILVLAQSGEVPVIRIEEDWELHVLQPDDQVDAPQVVTTMLPLGGDSDFLFQVDVNHGSAPAFEAGGLQIRINEDDVNWDERRIHEGVRLIFDHEVVTWTQVVKKQNDKLIFLISEGTSDSFGSFGGGATQIFITTSEAGEVSLNNYRHEDSIRNTSVTFASNRVQHLRLRSVRIYYADGAVASLQVNTDID